MKPRTVPGTQASLFDELPTGQRLLFNVIAPPKRRAAVATPARCPPHYCDNQGLCHYCGIVMEPDWHRSA